VIDGVSAEMEGMDKLVARFRELREAIAKADDEEMERNAEEMATTAEAAAPERKGVLRTTVRVIKKAPRHYLVVAGGPSTRKRVKKGPKPTFDYARADEFGTQEMAAQPFFWPTYRRLRRRFRTRINARRRAIIKAFKL
jgi:HK97 gp10 family phage protein